MIHDSKAEALEKAGLYRRAAARWLEVFIKSKHAEQEWILRRRNQCLVLARRKAARGDNFTDVRRAAAALQRGMAGVTGGNKTSRPPKKRG